MKLRQFSRVITSFFSSMLDTKYPQGEERFADTRNPLRDYDFDEEDLLNDLDQTSEVEKLRQQNFKLYRVKDRF